MQEYLREYTGSSRQGLGADGRGMRALRVRAHISGKPPAKQRRQQAALHARSMGGDIPTSVVQGQQAAQRRRRRNAGVPPGVHRRLSTSCPATATPRSQGLERLEVAKLSGWGGENMAAIRRSAFGSAPAAAPPQLFIAWAHEVVAACHRGEGEVQATCSGGQFCRTVHPATGTPHVVRDSTHLRRLPSRSGETVDTHPP